MKHSRKTCGIAIALLSAVIQPVFFPPGLFAQTADETSSSPVASTADESAAVRPPVSPELQQKASEIVKTYRNSLSFITGRSGAGSGFVAILDGKNYLITNAHVIAGIHDAAFKALDGTVIPPAKAEVAVAADVFRMETKEGGKPFEVMEDVEKNVAIGDDIVVLGNAESAGVINTLMGKVVGVGPNLIEIDAPILPGNSGSPIIHLKSGKVIGVATFQSVKKYDAATQAQLKTPVVRRFGYRIENVKTWQPMNSDVFFSQGTLVERVRLFTLDLDALNRDLASGNPIPAGKYNNPIIKSHVDQWLKDRSRPMSPEETRLSNASFVAFLKNASQSDIALVRPHITYDFFLRKLIELQKIRAEISKNIEGIVTPGVQ